MKPGAPKLFARSFVLPALLTPVYGVLGWLAATEVGVSLLWQILTVVGSVAFGLGNILHPLVIRWWRWGARVIEKATEYQHRPVVRAWIIWVLLVLLFLDIVLIAGKTETRAACLPVGLLLFALLLGYLGWQTRGGQRIRWLLLPLAGGAAAFFGEALPLSGDRSILLEKMNTKLVGFDAKLDALLAGQRQTHENQAEMQDLIAGIDARRAEYDPIRTAALSQGFDIEDVDASDFAVSFQTSYENLVLQIETSPSIEALASEGMLQARLGDRPWSMVYNDMKGGLMHMLDKRDIEADGPVELRLFANDGHTDSPTHGPYRFDIRVSEARDAILAETLEKVKRRVEQEAWLAAQRHGGWRFDFRFMREVGPLVRSIAIAKQEGEIETEWVLPRSPDGAEYGVRAFSHDPLDQIAMSSQEITSLLPYMKEAVLYVRVTFLDGSQSSWRRFDRISSVLVKLGVEASGEIRSSNDGVLRLSFSDLLGVDLGGEEPPYTITVRHPGSGQRFGLDFVPEGVRTQRLDQWFVQPRRVWGPIIPPEWSSVEATVTGDDGQVIAQHTFKVSTPDRWYRVPSPDPDAPALYADTGEGEHYSLRFLAFPPRATVSLLSGVGEIPTHIAAARPMFSWPCGRSPVLTGDFRILYQLEDGKEAGPFQYDLTALARLARVGAITDAARNRSRLLRAVRRDDDIGGTGFSRLQRHLKGTGLSREAYRDWVSGGQRGIILAPSNATAGVHGWAAVKQVRAGPSPDNLVVQSDVETDMEAIVRSRNNLGGLSGNSKMGLLWLPLETERVYIQFELFDGTILDPVEIPIIDADDL